MTVCRPGAVALVVLILMASPAAAQESPEPDEEPVTQEEIEDLRRKIEAETRSSVELLFRAYGDSGDLNNRLHYIRYGARVRLKAWKDRSFHVFGTRTHYASGDNIVEEAGTRIAVGFERTGYEGPEYEIGLGATFFSNDATTVDGLASVRFRPARSARLSLTAARTNVEETMLSAVGLAPSAGPFAGQRVGPVMENRLGLGGTYRLPWRLDVFAEASIGTRAGENVESNGFRRVYGGLGYSAIAVEEGESLSLLRLSASVFTLDFDENRLGFGGASLVDRRGAPLALDRLGSDGLPPEPAESNPGVGGYFSPQDFLSVTARVDVRGRASPSVAYEAYLFLGTQSYEGSDSSLAAGFRAEVALQLGDRLSVPVSVLWERFGPFNQRSVVASLRYLF